MTNLDAFRQFAKTKETGIDPNNHRTVIYSRVSTKDQEDNTSLANQYETCLKYVQREGLDVVAEFGGKGESAKAGSARAEYVRMLDFVRKKKNRIRYIVFYSYDRFSREGGKAIVTKEALKSLGIQVRSASMPIDTSTPFGEGMEDMQLIFAKIENDVRRNRTIEGMKAKLRSGYWCTNPPFGYKLLNGDLLIDEEKAPYIKMMFKWRFDDPSITPREIERRLAKKGIKLSRGSVRRALRNPVYAGLISHALLEGEIVEGRHKALVPKAKFLQVNKALNERYVSGYKLDDSNEDLLPLKMFTVCECCGTKFTGYVSRKRLGKPRKNPLPYYKGRVPKCETHISAHKFGDQFLELLKQYTVMPELAPLVGRGLKAILMDLNAERFEEEKRLAAKVKTLEAKLERLRERYILEEEISRSDYEEFSTRIREEKYGLMEELDKTRKNSSNLLNHIDKCVEIATNMAHIWENGDFHMKRRLQQIAFPEGITYNPKNDTVRTQRVNSIIELCSRIGEDFDSENSRNEGRKRELVHWATLGQPDSGWLPLRAGDRRHAQNNVNLLLAPKGREGEVFPASLLSFSV